MKPKKATFKTMKHIVTTIIPLVTGLSACQAQPDFQVSRESVAPSSKIDWMGNETRLSPGGALEVGKPLPHALLAGLTMKEEDLQPDARVRVISIVPSLDTEVCDRQTHLLSDTKVLDSAIERITVSRDLPYAQRRFAQESHLKNLRYLSDYRSGELGEKLGLAIERNGLLARAVIVTDARGVVRYFQIVPKIYTLPDMERAFQEANRVLAGG